MKKLPKQSLIGLAALCVLPAAVQAQLQYQEPYAGDTLQFRALAGLQHDSNVLRTRDGESDQVGVLGAGIRFDKQISLQRITIDAEANAYRHRDFSELNYETLNYNAAWNFSLTPRLRGTVSADRRQFRDVVDALGGGSAVDLRTERTEQVQGLYEIGGGWRAVGGLLQTRSRSDEPRAFESSPTVRSARVGGGYEFGSGASVYVRYRYGTGEYDNVVVGQDFKETEPDIVVRWPVTAKTTVDARVGYLRREHDDGGGFRDFSGGVFNANAYWDITAKTRLTGGFAREIGSYEFIGGGNVRTNRLYVGPMWMPTELVTVSLRYEREERDWNVGPASPDAARSDTTHYSSAMVEWTPRRFLTLQASLRAERRNSSIAFFDYDATIVGVGAKLTF
ncbi:XrtB/PEP-CTERM-associated polysaccharide biosynthesis outer membrane protein EpsL [Ramlibacter tataouinensis]|uniref:Uncharacterized protein n=1 Tax=Ramlibacter tataouinensis (strain ATCC BAA-407 / DSM 14655 / LMG 21543 / TTB310) TaxID=365046 RepID=F5Y0E1_RAMTT|nr:XrtB/PEP-CTERM-associated polysaccharide biosynthesis outer membrane protein EpsL [Ramlibacter tataouinensis]AEG92163.1 hypothetical protein Rta_10780 [Ramlibacter tataouinensis TTB310]